MNLPQHAPVALAALVATLISGCAATTGITGVTVRKVEGQGPGQSQVFALVRICEPYTASQVEAWVDAEGGTYGSGTWAMSGSSADVELGDRATMELWFGGELVTLGGVPSGGVAEPVHLTSSDLRNLPDGHVLVGGEGEPPTVLTLAEFDDEVDRLCN